MCLLEIRLFKLNLGNILTRYVTLTGTFIQCSSITSNVVAAVFTVDLVIAVLNLATTEESHTLQRKHAVGYFCVLVSQRSKCIQMYVCADFQL